TGTNTIADAITGAGTLELVSGATTLDANATQNTLTITAGTLTNNATATIVGGSNAGAILGSGTLANSGTFTNNGAITQTILTNSGTFNNDGTGITADVTNTSGTFNNNSDITGNVDIAAGTFNNNANIIGNVTNTGNLTTAADKVSGTMTNNGTMNLSGALEKAVLGNGTTKIDSELALNSGSSIAGMLDMNSGDLTLSAGSITQTDIKAIKGSGNILLDYNGSNIDTIRLTGDTSDAATITISSLTTPTGDIDDFSRRVLIGANANTQLSIAAALADEFHKEWSEAQHRDEPISTNTISYDDNYGRYDWTRNYTKDLGVAGSAEGLKDTLTYLTEHTDTPEVLTKAENIELMNTYTGEGSENRSINFDGIFDSAMAGIYTVTADIGTTADGTYTLNGVKNDSDGNTTVDFDGYKGFDVSSSDATVVIKNIDIKNAAYIADVSAGELDLNNVNTDGTNGSGIINDGTIKFTGTNVIADAITNGANETGVLQIVSGATTLNADTTQNTLTVASGTLTNNANATITDGSNSGTILGSGTLANSGTFTNSGAITQSTVVNSGTFNNDGTGITANVTNTSGTFNNNSGITGNVDIAAGTFNNNASISGNVTNAGILKSNADNLNGNVTNNGSLNLSGGTLNSTINGSGNTAFSGDITANSDITQKALAVNDDITFINNGVTTINTALTNRGTISGGGAVVNKGNATNDGVITVSFTNEGNVTNNSLIQGDYTNNGTNAKITTSMAGLTGNITNNGGEIHYTDGGKTVADIHGDGSVYLDGNQSVVLNHSLDANNLVLNNGTLLFGQNTDISQGGLTANGGSINTLDGKVSQYKLGNVVANGNTNLAIDFDLDTLTSDSFIGTYSGAGKLNIDKVQISGTTIKDSIRVYLGDTTKIADAQLSATNQKLPTIMTPIKKMYGKIEDNYLVYAGASGGGVSDYNPAIFASPVAAELGGFLIQSQALQDGFYHLNRYSKYSLKDRLASENANKYALNTEGANPTYIRESIPETSQAFWGVPYTSFEKVKLRGGVKVSNITYGGMYGGDTDLVDVGHGFKRVYSTFVGYNGAHQTYNGVSTNMQGGMLGFTGTWYKRNFFTAFTASVGASAGEAHTSFGTDYFSMLTAGVGNKTGYNIEFADGRYILQPQLYTGYIFTNPFDYKNSAGVKITSDPLHAIQVAPGIKFIANFQNGVQAYAGVDVMMNFMGKTKYMANETKLPELSVKPYVQYGVGVQKSWGERFTCFFQTMLRNGGRNGVSLSAGLRWLVGKDPKKEKENEKI
ncbi:MAG: hypothetical protein K6A44_00950, partial [bacterium]|nr:hypothetical protein [bacterium]